MARVAAVLAPLWALFWALLWAAAATPAAAQYLVTEPCMGPCPQGTATLANQVIVRPAYTLSNNPVTKFADWIAYAVDARNFGPSRPRDWRADPDLPASATLEPDDYRDAAATLKTDRGHQAPLASFAGMESWATTNYLSNITPQASALNQGPWVRLETAVRSLASRSGGAVHVVTGPLYERPMPSLLIVEVCWTASDRVGEFWLFLTPCCKHKAAMSTTLSNTSRKFASSFGWPSNNRLDSRPPTRPPKNAAQNHSAWRVSAGSKAPASIMTPKLKCMPPYIERISLDSVTLWGDISRSAIAATGSTVVLMPISMKAMALSMRNSLAAMFISQ